MNPYGRYLKTTSVKADLFNDLPFLGKQLFHVYPEGILYLRREDRSLQPMQAVDITGDTNRQVMADNIGKPSQATGIGKVQANLFKRLPFSGMPQTCILLFNTAAGKTDVSGPWVIGMMCPLDEEQFQPGTALPEDQGNGSQSPLLGLKLQRLSAVQPLCYSMIVESSGNHEGTVHRLSESVQEAVIND